MKNITYLLILLLTSTNVFSTNYYVSTNGSNSNNGNISNQWLTIQYGVDQLSPGDILHIMGGTYPEQIYFNVSGSAGQMITVKAYLNQNVIIDANSFSNGNAIFYVENHSYYRIEGIHFKNNYSTSGSGGIYVDGYGSNIEIINCTFSNIAISTNPNLPVTPSTYHPVVTFEGTSSSDSIHNVLVEGIEIYNCRTGYSECLTLGGNVTDFEIINNHIHDNTNIGIDIIGNEGICSDPVLDHTRRGIIKNNHSHHNISPYSPAAGIYVDGGYDVLIENNILHHNGYGVEIGCEQSGNAKNITVRNNIIYLNANAGAALGGYDSGTGGYVEYSKVLNNTFYHNDTDFNGNGSLLITQFENCEINNNIFYLSSQNFLMSENRSQPSLNMDYNLIYCDAGQSNIEAYWNGNSITGLSNIYSTASIGANDTYGDPLFIDVANFDFHIPLGSAALNSGDPSFTPASGEVDLDGQNRMNGIVDCGADEHYITTDVHELKMNSISIFPNPTLGKIHFSRNFSSSTIYNVINLNGKIIEVGKIPFNNIDLSHLKSGIYFIKIINEKEAINHIVKLTKH